MQGSARSGGRILYRCDGKARALPPGCTHPPTVYVREDTIVGRLDSWLASLATPEALADVAKRLAAYTTSPQVAVGLRYLLEGIQHDAGRKLDENGDGRSALRTRVQAATDSRDRLATVISICND